MLRWYWCIYILVLASTPIYTFQRKVLPFFHNHHHHGQYNLQLRNEHFSQLRGGSDRSEGPTVHEPEVWVEPKRALVLMDVFSEYHGIFLSQQARLAYGVATISVLSEYMKGYFEREAPDELDRWQNEFLPSEDRVQEWKNSVKDVELVAIVCESDSGLADAERFGNQLQLSYHNGFNEARRNKFMMIETLREAGLDVVKQRLCGSVEEAIDFAQELGVHSDVGESMVVVKPVRGVASDDVHLCKDLLSVTQAFAKIHGSPVFGAPWEKHAKVLVQEFAIGQEFAVDVVCKNGETKIAAMWIYDKRPANGAPFVYFSTEVYDGEHNQILYDYLSRVLDALDIRWGLTHSEVILTSDGPRLVEVNCRQHNMDFLPIVMACYGYNAFDMLLAAYLGENSKEDFPSETAGLRLDWDLLPCIPTRRMKGAMVHLSCFVSGTLRSVNERALHEFSQMESVIDLEVYGHFLQVGNQLEKTIDIRTDCGWVQLVNPSGDPECFERDFQRIVELMPTLFVVDE